MDIQDPLKKEEMPVCAVHDLGMVEYDPVWRLQEQWAGEIARGERPASLLLLQHPHTYTFGRQGHAANLLWTESELQANGVQVFWVDRGGDITYHGPGQLVGYPLLPLSPGGLLPRSSDGMPRLPQADYVGYLRRLEVVLIRTLAHFGVTGMSIPGLTGVWVQAQAGQPPAKLAAIGVKVDVRGVSRHGFALNIAPEMRYWEGLIGCGLDGYPVTSLAQLCPICPALADVQTVLVDVFGEVFAYKMQLN